MKAVELARLTPLMERTSGRSDVVIALIDGPVVMDHPDLQESKVRYVSRGLPGMCSDVSSTACIHGTFVAGILSARRSSPAPAICPGCTLLIRPIFPEKAREHEGMPSATPAELAEAIVDVVDEGARVVNLSVSLAEYAHAGQKELAESLSYAAVRGTLIVAATGNQSSLGGTALTGHVWTIPVIACDSSGRPASSSNLCGSAGRWGLTAPGENITSTGPGDSMLTLDGTSAATPFVAGTAALLCSEFPRAGAGAVKVALTQSRRRQKAILIPPLLDAWAAYQSLAAQA